MLNLEQYFLLKKDITYLNFGSFGATVKPVFKKYQDFQLELEQEPVKFITDSGLRYLADSRKALGAYVGAHMDDLVFVTNPSYAVNAVAKSFPLQAGDEVLATGIEYGACDKTWNYYCRKAGAVYVRQKLTIPVVSKEELISEFLKGITSKTKLIFISHITSSTGLRLPVEEICARAKEKGIITFVDGAHSPGQIPLNIAESSFDFYTGACHKWMMTPKGSSFLYAKKELQPLVDPLIISWGYDALFPSHSRFLDYHQTNGTRDYSAFLTIPAAIDFMKEHDWEEVSAACRALTLSNASEFCDLLGTSPLAPADENFFVQLFSAEVKTKDPEKLHQVLYDEFRIQIPVMRQDGNVYLRYSINGFNNQHDIDILFNAIRKIKRETTLIS